MSKPARRLTALLTVLSATTFLPASASAGAAFPYGVAAGEVTPASAQLWTRAPKAGRGTLQVSTDRRFGRGDRSERVTASRANDLTAQTVVRKLRAGRGYFYRFKFGKTVSPVGRFTTSPPANRAATIEFAFSGDSDAARAPGTTKPFYNNFEVFGQMAKEGNDFNVNFGDTIYSDSEIAGLPVARTVSAKWAKYKQNLALGALPRLRGTSGLYSHFDDHEFINDFSLAEEGQSIFNNGIKAFRDYAPVTYTNRDGLYRTFRWGRNLEVFFLDERSFRDAKASSDGTCDNPDTGEPDLAPTAPQSKRNVFAALVPSLAQPVSQACLDRINDPSRTFLGQRQYDAFTKAVKASTARFKVIMNEMPIQQYFALPYDRWEGYASERTRLLETLSAEVKNVIFLTTDVHANLVNDARFSTFAEEGGQRDSGILEVTTGPVATRTFRKEIDAATGREGSGKAISDAFFRPAPPDGLGMRCAATDVFSYAQVKVTSSALTVTPKNASGLPIRDDGDRPCGPFTIPAG